LKDGAEQTEKLSDFGMRTGVYLTDPLEEAAGRPAGSFPCRFWFAPQTMAKITYIDSGGTARTVDAETGSTVMETAIKNDIPGIEAECGGACACATCHVYVDQAWREKVGGPSPMEEDMLDFGYDVRENSRLSCQIKVTEELDGLLVTTPSRQA
jgi:2Fe-2S ferredoxin